MTPEAPHKVYLSLGSNSGNRPELLRNALQALASAGKVVRTSPVYETAAWGFDGPDFLNQVVLLETFLEPDELLTALRQIETSLGRLPNGRPGYENRPIDIDILTYDDRVISTDRLTVPHPRLAQRKFVLQPWNDIAPDFRVPDYGKTVSRLLEETTDTTPVRRYDYGHRSLPYRFLSIEGNIGAGKTTLAKMMARDFNGQLVLERFEENPFLPKFYEDPARYAFPLEMSFLADRYQQFLDLWTQPGLFSDITISDYFVIKSLIFAGVTLGEDEYELYRKIFRFMYRDLKKPDLYVYLYRQADDLIRNIARRGRDYEKNITADYLRKVHAAYLQFIRQQKDMPVLILDVTGVDFVRDPWKYDEIVDEIVRRKDDPALVVTRQIMP